MNEQNNNGQLHRRLSPSAKKKRRRARQRRQAVLLLGAVLVFAAAIGLIWWIPTAMEAGASAPSASATAAPSAAPTAEPTATPAPTATPDPMANVNVTWNTTGIEGYDYLIAINRAADTVTIYTKDENGNYLKPYFAMICSTGEATPLGEYRTIEEYDWRYLQGNVYGQYAVRIVGHILFHSVPYYTQHKDDLKYEEFNKLGTPASLGCIRLQVQDAKWIYDECKIGTPVVLYDDADNPGPLGKPDFTRLDLTDDTLKHWDPTDPDPANPWNQVEGRPTTNAPAA